MYVKSLCCMGFLRITDFKAPLCALCAKLPLWVVSTSNGVVAGSHCGWRTHLGGGFGKCIHKSQLYIRGRSKFLFIFSIFISLYKNDPLSYPYFGWCTRTGSYNKVPRSNRGGRPTHPFGHHPSAAAAGRPILSRYAQRTRRPQTLGCHAAYVAGRSLRRSCELQEGQGLDEADELAGRLSHTIQPFF